MRTKQDWYDPFNRASFAFVRVSEFEFRRSEGGGSSGRGVGERGEGEGRRGRGEHEEYGRRGLWLFSLGPIST